MLVSISSLFMFGVEFYPTPKAIALRMIEALKRDRRIVRLLDPSAGKGDLLDVSRYHASEVKAIELDPDLASTLKGKKYAVIGSDFLEFNEKSSFDSIIMNPPFSDGIDHLLHAWEILSDGGRVVCLLPVTVLNQGNQTKAKLSQLIEIHGSVENLGDCFADAERKTSVEVVMITLDKPKTQCGFNFSIDDFTVENIEAAISTNKTATLGKNDVIKTLVHQYELAVEALRQKFVAQEQLNFALQGIAVYVGESNKEPLTSRVTYPEMLAELKARFWRTVFIKTELQSRATSDFQEKFTNWANDQVQLAFTESNIKEMLLMFWQNKSQIDDDSLCHVFDYLTRNHANCVVGEGWKTNKASKLNTKMIIERGINHSSWGFATCHHRTSNYNDIDKAMCILSGTNIKNIVTIDSALSSWVHKRTDTIESTFFHIKVFKKGTVHLQFKDKDLNERFNTRVGKLRQWIGSDY